MMKISIEQDFTEVDKAFREVPGVLARIHKKMLAAVASKGKTKVRQNYGRYLKKQSGGLYSSIKSVAKGSEYSLILAGRYYANCLEKGYTILPKRGKVLHFIANGVDVFTRKAIRVKRKPFFSTALDGFIGSSEYYKTIQGAYDKEVSRILEKL